MKHWLALLTTLVLSTSLMAKELPPEQRLTLTVEEVVEDYVTNKNLIVPKPGRDTLVEPSPGPGPGPITSPSVGGSFSDGVATAGQVISVARDLVALGEAIYELVSKGKPKNVSEYAPISVVPKDPMTKEFVDPFDLENFSMPVEKNFIARINNAFGKEVVTFKYKVLFSHGGSYNGAGQYLTGVIIVPGEVKTSWGWEFNASMKLSGVMNHGTRGNPVAGVMVTVKYQMNGFSAALERNDTMHITGRGEFRNHNEPTR
jgi:hypothetical protein